MCYVNVLIFKSTNISKRTLLFLFKSWVDTRRITWPQGSSMPHVARWVRICIITLPCNQLWLLHVWVHPSCPRTRGSNSLWTHQQSMTVKLCIFKRFNMPQLQLVHFTFFRRDIQQTCVRCQPQTQWTWFLSMHKYRLHQPAFRRRRPWTQRAFPAHSHFTSHLWADTAGLQSRANTSTTAPLQNRAKAPGIQVEERLNCCCFYPGKSLLIIINR